MNSVSKSEGVARVRGDWVPQIKNAVIYSRFKIAAVKPTVISIPLTIFIPNETFESTLCAVLDEMWMVDLLKKRTSHYCN